MTQLEEIENLNKPVTRRVLNRQKSPEKEESEARCLLTDTFYQTFEE